MYEWWPTTWHWQKCERLPLALRDNSLKHKWCERLGRNPNRRFVCIWMNMIMTGQLPDIERSVKDSVLRLEITAECLKCWWSFGEIGSFWRESYLPSFRLVSIEFFNFIISQQWIWQVSGKKFKYFRSKGLNSNQFGTIRGWVLSSQTALPFLTALIPLLWNKIQCFSGWQ